MKIKQQMDIQAIQQHMTSNCINKSMMQSIKGGNDPAIIDEIDGF